MPTPLIISYPQAAGTPLSGGKCFFVSDITGASWIPWNVTYQPDFDGINRVYTTLTLALAQTVAGRGDYIELAPDYVTAPSASDVLTAETNGVTVLQFGKQLLQRFFAERALATIPQNTSYDIFTVTGKVRVREIIGQVTTAIQNADTQVSLFAKPTSTNLTSTGLCAAGSISNLVTDGTITITGTLSAKFTSTGNAAVIDQASAVIVHGGSIRFKSTTSAARTGAVKWRIEYEPITPGARVFSA